jgi:HPt (histidine-containing phosphotransfer) domain-containing protein
MKKPTPKPQKSQTLTGNPTLLGILLGCSFPIVATFLDLFEQGLSITLGNIVATQAAQPLHWLIDLVPFVFGLFANLTGQQRPGLSPQMSTHIERKAAERTAKLSRTIEELKAELAEQKRVVEELQGSEAHYRTLLENAKAKMETVAQARTTTSAASQQTEEESWQVRGRQGEIVQSAPAAMDAAPPAFSVSENGLIKVPGLSPGTEYAPQHTTAGVVTPAPIGVAVQIPEEPFNLSEALARVDGDRELLKEMAELFLEEFPRFLSDIQTALSNNDPQTLTYAAHTLKGSVGNFAAAETVEAARQLEQIGRHGDLSEAAAVLVRLEDALEHLRPALNNLAMEVIE